MNGSKMIVAATLASLSFAASADRADRRDEHYFWEQAAAVQPLPPATGELPRVAAAGERPLMYGSRSQRFVITPSVRSRAEVIAELREAHRLGLVGIGEADTSVPTPAQEASIAAAGKARSISGAMSQR